MTVILVLGLAWLLAATVVATVIGQAIHLADLRSSARTSLDRLLAGCCPDADAAHAPGAGRDRSPRTA